MKRLELLDIGRLAAALAVVAFHYFFNGINNGKISSVDYTPGLADFAKYGYLGVEFFFMISGYVIFFSARNCSAREFAVSRCVRLFPAFWVAVVFTTFFSRLWGGSLMTVYWPQFLANLTMLPAVIGYPFVDGVYWTLQLELSFYLLVLLCLMAGWQNRLAPILLAWPFAILSASLAGAAHLPFLGGYYCFFAAGTVLAILKERPSWQAIASLATSIYLCLAFSAASVAEYAVSKNTPFSVPVVGAVILIQFAFFLFLNTRNGSSLKIPGSKLAGALTYPIYLVHAYFGYMVISRFGNAQNKIWIYALTIVIAFVTAYLIHVLVERRYAAFWRALFCRSIGAMVEMLHHRMVWVMQRIAA